MSGQMSNLKIGYFSTLQVYISSTFSRSDMTLFPVCFPFNSERNDVQLRYIDRILVMHTIPEENVSITGKIAAEQIEPMALIDIGKSQGTLQIGIYEK